MEDNTGGKHYPDEDLARFQQIADIAPAMLWVTDSSGYCTFLSQGWYHYTGQTEVTGLGYGWIDAVHPDDREYAQQTFLEALAQQKAFQIDYRVRRYDGKYRWAIDAARPNITETGVFLGFVGSVIEIHERKMINVMQDALRDSEEKYRTLFNSIDQGFCICEMIVDSDGRPIDYRFLEVNARFENHTGLKDATGKTALEMLPDLEPHWIETYGKVALTGERLHIVQGSDVMGRWFDVYAFRIDEPQLHRFAVLFTEISERKRAETRSQLLQHIAAALSTAVTQEDVIDIFINQGVAHLGADAGTIMILDEDQTHLQIVGALGYSRQVIEKWQRIPLDHPTVPISIAIRDQRPLWLGSPEERAVIAPLTPNLSTEEQHQAWAVLPFRLGNDLIGAIGLGYNAPRTFDDAERTLFLTLTDYCAQALDRARLSEKMRALATTEERQRLARDLHDTVSQVLFASTSIAESLPQVWERDLEQGRAYLRNLVTLNRGALAEMRKLLLELRPEAIVRTPLGTLLQHLTSALQAQKEIDVEISVQPDNDSFLPENPHVALYRITQEALNNVIKHSEASHLRVDFLHGNPQVRLVIEDNGRGFDPKRASMGIGMNSMRERAAGIGASLVIESEPGAGTRLTIEWEAPDEEKA